MKRILLIISIIYACSMMVMGQTWQWSENLRSNGNVIPSDIVTDANNNVYVCGYYENSSLSIGLFSLTNVGDRDIFICKFNASGSLQWLKSIGGTGRDEATSLSIIHDTLYVLGNYQSTYLFFTPNDSISCDDNWDSYLAKFDLDGNFAKAIKLFSGTQLQRSWDMVFDPVKNELAIATVFRTELKYTNNIGPITIPAKSTKDLLITRSNLSGVIQDTAIHTTAVANNTYFDIDLSNDGGYYISGDLFGTLNFGGGNSITGTGTSTYADMLIVKVNGNLDFQWARNGGGTGYDHANSLVSDKYGNAYIAGKIEGTVVFDSTATLPSQSITGSLLSDLYLAKYNKLGNLQWVRRKGNTGSDDAFGLAQRENLIQFCGNYAGQVIFNTDTLTSTGTADINTGFAVFNTKGSEIGAKGIGGINVDRGEIISFSPNGNTIISGYYLSSSIIIGDSNFTNSSGTNNGFIASYYYPMNAVFTSKQNILCNGANTGRLIVTPYFGTSPYQYNWSSNVSSHQDSLAYNLPAGTYSVTVIDSHSDTATTSIVLTQPSAINIASSQSDVSCYFTDGPSSNGAINITVTGGKVTSGYSYNWAAISGSGVHATSEDQNSLTAGVYSVSVTDNNLCEAADTFTIMQPVQITFDQSVVENVIIGVSLGSVNLTVAGGTPIYTFSWNGPGGFTSGNEDIGSLTGGSYSVLVTDSRFCQADTSFLVGNDTMLVAYISNKTDIDCHGYSNGSATVTVSGGIGPFNYAWQNSGGNPIGGNSPNLTGIGAGTYYVTVTNTPDNRTAESSVQILEPSAELSSSIVGTNVLCYENATGVADLTVNGGTLPYDFLWSNASEMEDLLDMPAGKYFITVTDYNNCTDIDSITITGPLAMDINITIDQPVLCNGDLTGILTASASGGTGTKSYVWDDPGNQTSQTATSLQGGTYTVTATDLNGCTVTGERLLIEPAVLSLTESHQDITCFGAEDGSINLSVSGGTPLFNYEWSNGVVAQQDLTNLTMDTYSVTVTDAYNCVKTLSSVVINEPTEIAFQDVVITDASCKGYADAEISLSALGGSGTYEYSINGGTSYSANALFSDLTAQSYTLKVRDALDCESSDSIVTVDEPEGTTIALEEVTDASCLGHSDGTITITATSLLGDLTYSIDTGITFLDNNGLFTGLPVDSYQVQIRDNNSCIEETGILIVHGEEVVDILTETSANVTCNGSQDGSVTVTATSPAAPLTYSIDNGQNFFTNNGLFDQLPSGSYQVLARDTNECLGESGVLIINEPAEVIIQNISITDASCDGSSGGEISITGTGGSGTYEYSINGGTSYSNNSLFSDLIAQDYTLRIRDTSECESPNSIVTVNTALEINIVSSLITNASCNGSSDAEILIAATGGSGSYQYSINGGTSYSGNALFSDLAAQDYTLRVRDDSDCQSSNSIVTVHEPDAIIVDTTITHANGNVNGVINAEASGGTSSFNYTLLNDSMDTLETTSNGTFADVLPGNYLLYAYDNNSCRSDTLEIAVLQMSTSVIIYDAFSPNGDGRNDVWNIGNVIQYPNISINIFNTWGNRVFRADNGYTEPWDGTYNGKDLPAATYYYVIDLHDGSEVYTGSVCIVR